MIKAYRENSLRVDSEEMRNIRYAARENQMYERATCRFSTSAD